MNEEEELDFDGLLAAFEDEKVGTAASALADGPMSVQPEEAPLGRSLNMADVRAEQPAAPVEEVPRWLRALAGGSDPANNALGNTMREVIDEGDPANAPDLAAINALAAGGVHNVAAGLERRAPGVREWSIEAEREKPGYFATGDMAANMLPTPLNKVAAATRLIPAAGKAGLAMRFGGDLAMQTGIGIADSAARRYGDAGGGANPEYSFGEALGDSALNEGIATAVMSVPGAGVGALGARGAARQATPEARALRHQDYEIARLRSAGYTDDAIDELRAQPEKFANVMSEVERLAAQRGGSYTVPQMARDVRGAQDEMELAKRSAAEALASGGATVNPMDVSDKIRADARASHPGAEYGVAADSDYVQGADAIASRYSSAPRPKPQPVSASPGAEPVTMPPPPLPAGPPPEDPIGALAELGAADGRRANPPGFAELAAADEARLAAEPMDIDPRELEPVVEPPPPPRVVPRSKALPPPPEPMAAYRALGVQEPPGNTLGGERFDGRLAAPDPIGALAAQSSAPPSGREPGFAALGVPDPPPENAFAPVGVASPDPNAVNTEFLAAAAARRPPPAPPYNVPPVAPAPPVPPGMEAPPLPDEYPLRSPNIYNGPSVQASPLDNAAAFGSLSGVPPNFDPGPAPVPFNAYVSELGTVGQKIKPELAKPEDAFQRERYAAVDHAMDLGAERASPEMQQQWADSKANQGSLALIADQAGATRNASPPLGDLKGSAASAALGGLGSGLGYSMGMGALGASGLGAVGLGAGLAGNAWYQPRKHSLTANWLSGDTSARMERLSGVGQKPVGSLTSGFGDLMREPPPPAAETGEPDNDPNGPTSALSPGEFLGRNVTQTMMQKPDMFMAYADDYSTAGTDDRRAAVTERLYRTDPDFARNVFPIIGSQGSETA